MTNKHGQQLDSFRTGHKFKCARQRMLVLDPIATTVWEDSIVAILTERNPPMSMSD